MKRIGFVKIACVIAAFCVATAVASFAQTFTSLASFDKTDGEAPWYSSVVQGADGNLYGMTPFGGSSVSSFCSGCGTVYKITPSGELTTIYSFCSQNNCTDGWEPFHGLTLGTDGNFYGTTQKGGANCIVSIGGCGTIFKVTPGGSLTTLYNFCEQAQCTDGSTPQAGLVQGTDGNFYGTTWEGGAGGWVRFSRLLPRASSPLSIASACKPVASMALSPLPGWSRATTATFTARPPPAAGIREARSSE